MRNNSRRLLGAALALTMAVLLAATVPAAGGGPLPGAAPQDIPFAAAAPGKTTVGVQVTRQDPNNLAFEVPLYMTVAVVNQDGQPTVLCPTGYSIHNSTIAPDGTTPPIAVTGMVVQGAQTGTWSLSKETPTAPKTIGLSVGGVHLPNVQAGDTDSVIVDLKATGSSFYASGKYVPLTQQGTLLALKGVLPANAVINSSVPPTPQFRLIYTMSLLDGSGTPIGVVYDGPERAEAVTPAP